MTTPTVIEVAHVEPRNAETKLREVIAATPGPHQQRLNELAYLAYETIRRGKFGNGMFNVAMTCTSSEFVVSVKREG